MHLSILMENMRRAGARRPLLLPGEMGVAFEQRIACVLLRQLNKLVLGAALRLMQHNLRALALAQHAGDVLRLLGQLQHSTSLAGCLPSS